MMRKRKCGVINGMAEKLSVKIYNGIKEDIEKGRIDFKDFISEAQVAEKYQVSKAPVRDALHLLAKQGYLVSYPRKGYMVNHFTINEVNQIQLIRRQIEYLSVELIIKQASDEEIQSLYAYVDEKDGTSGNSEFHLAMAGISGNKFLPDALSELLSKIRIAKKSDEVNHRIHRALIEALKERNVEKAHKCLEEDIAFL